MILNEMNNKEDGLGDLRSRLVRSMINDPINIKSLAKVIGVSSKPLRTFLTGESVALLTLLKIEKYLLGKENDAQKDNQRV